jgi:hypothetical protein
MAAWRFAPFGRAASPCGRAGFERKGKVKVSGSAVKLVGVPNCFNWRPLQQAELLHGLA